MRRASNRMMPIHKLQKLKSIYKKEYITAVLEEDDDVNLQLRTQQTTLKKTYATIEDLIMDIEEK